MSCWLVANKAIGLCQYDQSLLAESRFPGGGTTVPAPFFVFSQAMPAGANAGIP